MSGRPNVICLVVDQLRHDHLGCTGNDVVRTPHIDSLAREGVLCERSYVSNPLCMPARASLLTGRRPRDHGVRTNGIPLPRDVPTLPEMLSREGYHTHSVGKLHLQGYDYPFPLEQEARATMGAGERQRIVRQLKERGLWGPDRRYEDSLAESRAMWKSGLLKQLPTPYYGFDTTDFVGSHVDGAFGEYEQWLRDAHPDDYDRLFRSHPDNTSLGFPNGFTWSLPERCHYNRWIADRTQRFLEETDDDDPFFLWCSFPDPHHPFAAPEPWGSMYDPDEVALPDRRDGELADLPPFYEEIYESGLSLDGIHRKAKMSDDEIRTMIAVTYGMISFLDQEVGRILEEVERQGLLDETVIVFLSDHGDMMGDHWMVQKGPFSFDGLLRTPLIWNGPGIAAGDRIDDLVSHLDLVPTLLELCDTSEPGGPFPSSVEGASIPAVLPGHSIEPALRGDDSSDRETLIVENDQDYLGLRIRTFVTERYKLTVYPGESYGELYDLDDGELFNRWDDPAYESVKAEVLERFLDAYIAEDAASVTRTMHS